MASQPEASDDSIRRKIRDSLAFCLCEQEERMVALWKQVDLQFLINSYFSSKEGEEIDPRLPSLFHLLSESIHSIGTPDEDMLMAS